MKDEKREVDRPDFYIEKTYLGEIEQKDRRLLEKMSADEVQLEMQNLKQENTDFLNKYSFDRFLNDVKNQEIIAENEKSLEMKRAIDCSKAEKKSVWNYLIKKIQVPVIFSVLAVCALFIILPKVDQNIDEQPTIRAKGELPTIRKLREKSALIAIFRDGSLVEKNALLKNGDEIELQLFSAEEYKYALLFEIDGNKGVFQKLDVDMDGQHVIKHQGNAIKSFDSIALKLDNAPDFERFILLLSPEKIDMTYVFSHLKKINIQRLKNPNNLNLDLPSNTLIHHLYFRK